MRIVTFNANGLRSAANKGFFDWFALQDVDVLCIQETKAQEHQLGGAAFRPTGYRAEFKDAVKKGYSGVAIYTRRAPDRVLSVIGWSPFDDEGRYLELRFGSLSIVSIYVPSGSSSPERQAFKYAAMVKLTDIFESWRHSGRDYVLCGDWNIVRSAQDIKNWHANQKNSGCLPEERQWMNDLCGPRGWLDSFRVLKPDGVAYTWWSQRGAARANDVGWRIDYQIVSASLRARLRDCQIVASPRFSDHAPFVVDYSE